MKISIGLTTYEIKSTNVERCEGVVVRHNVTATRQGRTPSTYNGLASSEAVGILDSVYSLRTSVAREMVRLASLEADLHDQVIALQARLTDEMEAVTPKPKQTVTLRRVSAEYPWVAYLNGSSIATLNDSWVESAEHMSDQGYIVEVCVASTSPNGLWDCTCAECEALQRAADDDADAAEYDARDGSHMVDY